MKNTTEIVEELYRRAEVQLNALERCEHQTPKHPATEQWRETFAETATLLVFIHDGQYPPALHRLKQHIYRHEKYIRDYKTPLG